MDDGTVVQGDLDNLDVGGAGLDFSDYACLLTCFVESGDHSFG